MEKINTFKELLNEIAWSWQYPVYDLQYHESDNRFSLNKLSITSEHLEYKGDYEELAPGVFDELKRFYEFLKSTEKK